MDISKIKLKSNFLSTYRNQNKNKKLSHVVQTSLNAKRSMADTLEINELKVQLSKAQTSENHIQEGVSLLQEKNQAMNSLNDMSNELKQISYKYNSGGLSDGDKQDIEKQANEIINDMNSVLNSTFGDKSVFNKQINVETSHGSDIVINVKSFDVSIDSDINKYEKKDKGPGFHIEGNLNIKDILKDTDRIENNLIKPLDKYSDNIKNQIVGLVNDVMYQDMVVHMSAKELGDLGAIDGDEENKIEKNSDRILKDATNALYCQSSGLDNNTVSQLLK